MLRRFILLCFGEMFCSLLLGLFGSWYLLAPVFLCLGFFLYDLSTGESRVLKFSTTNVLDSVCDLSFSDAFCFCFCFVLFCFVLFCFLQ